MISGGSHFSCLLYLLNVTMKYNFVNWRILGNTSTVPIRALTRSFDNVIIPILLESHFVHKEIWWFWSYHMCYHRLGVKQWRKYCNLFVTRNRTVSGEYNDRIRWQVSCFHTRPCVHGLPLNYWWAWIDQLLNACYREWLWLTDWLIGLSV